MKKILCILFCCVILLSASPIYAAAVTPYDANQPLTLTVQFIYTLESENIAIPGADFDVYHVADADEIGWNFTLKDEFLAHADEITNLSRVSLTEADEWQTLASDLKALVAAENIAAFDSGVTDENGIIEFPTSINKKFTPGLYLVVGHNCSFNGYTYESLPSLVMVPSASGGREVWDYDVTVIPKHSRYREKEKITVTVTKMWEDDDRANLRPTEITVSLIGDGDTVETVKLSADNNWTYNWRNLDRDVEWNVYEEAVDKYSASIQRTGNTFVVKNTYTGGNTGGDDGDDDKRGKLPQTGVLWWPIPVMAFLGIILIVVGCEIRNRCHERSL